MRYSTPLNIVRYSNGTLVKLTASAHDFISYDYDPDTDTGTYTPGSITLTASILGNLTYNRWQYRKDGGSWTDIPASNSLGITIATTKLTIVPSSSLFDRTNSYVLLRCVAKNNDNGEEYTDIAEIGRIVDYILLYRKQQTKIDQDAGKIALIASDEQLRQYGRTNTVVSDLAALKVTAGEISTTVSRKVGANEIISKINQTAETIKISADKVNIAGAAIFTTGRLSQANLNNTYDAKNTASTAIGNLKNDLASASGTTVINGGHIQTGTIDASKASIINLNASNIKAGTISDKSGKNSWNLESGQFKTTQAQIGPFTLNETGFVYSDSRSRFTLDQEGVSTVRRAITADVFISGVKLRGGKLDFVYSTSNDYDIGNASSAGNFVIARTTSDPHYYGITYIAGDNTTRLVMLEEGPTNPINLIGNTFVSGNFTVASGYTKSRETATENYGKRLQYCYETPTPLFGDIGEAAIDEDGFAYVEIDDIFSETIGEKSEYQVFLQKEGEGDCWIAEKQPRYFVIQGTSGLRVAWELKAKQKEFINLRLEPSEKSLEEYVYRHDEGDLLENYITEQEALLYG